MNVVGDCDFLQAKKEDLKANLTDAEFNAFERSMQAAEAPDDTGNTESTPKDHSLPVLIIIGVALAMMAIVVGVRSGGNGKI